MKDFSERIPLIGVGPARTASTWLYQVLVDTGHVERPSTKEVSFFNRHYEKQLTWYKSNFTDTGLDYWVDITPQYIDNYLYCERIYHTFPDAYILLGIRDPIERIKSLFKWYYYATRSRWIDDYEVYLLEVLPQQIYIAERIDLLDQMYRDRLVVVRYEALKRDPVAYAKQILARCRIAAPPPLVSNYVVNALYIPKMQGMAGIGKSLFRPIRALLPPSIALPANEVGKAVLTQGIILDAFLGEHEFRRMIQPHIARIDREKRIIEELLGDKLCV